MDDKASIYWEFCKRGLDTRRLAIIAAMAVVTSFGAWALQKYLSGESIFSWDDPTRIRYLGRDLPFACIKASIILLVPTGGWAVYLLLMSALERNIRSHLERTLYQLQMQRERSELSRLQISPLPKYLAPLLGTVIIILILLPLESGSHPPVSAGVATVLSP